MAGWASAHLLLSSPSFSELRSGGYTEGVRPVGEERDAMSRGHWEVPGHNVTENEEARWVDGVILRVKQNNGSKLLCAQMHGIQRAGTGLSLPIAHLLWTHCVSPDV